MLTTLKPEDVVLPIIHLNGDRASTLLARLKAAYDAVAVAMDALEQTAPNARNYYLVSGRLEQAQHQHAARQWRLHDVLHSLEAEIQGIQNLATDPRN